MDYWCDHRGCARRDASPQFTKRLKDVKGKRDQEPKWYCSRHRRYHPNVSPTTGKEVTRAA